MLELPPALHPVQQVLQPEDCPVPTVEESVVRSPLLQDQEPLPRVSDLGREIRIRSVKVKVTLMYLLSLLLSRSRIRQVTSRALDTCNRFLHHTFFCSSSCLCSYSYSFSCSCSCSSLPGKSQSHRPRYTYWPPPTRSILGLLKRNGTRS